MFEVTSRAAVTSEGNIESFRGLSKETTALPVNGGVIESSDNLVVVCFSDSAAALKSSRGDVLCSSCAS